MFHGLWQAASCWAGARALCGSCLLPDPGCVVVPYLYIGFLAKKKHLLDEPLPPKVFAGLLAATALIAVALLLPAPPTASRWPSGHWGR